MKNPYYTTGCPCLALNRIEGPAKTRDDEFQSNWIHQKRSITIIYHFIMIYSRENRSKWQTKSGRLSPNSTCDWIPWKEMEFLLRLLILNKVYTKKTMPFKDLPNYRILKILMPTLCIFQPWNTLENTIESYTKTMKNSYYFNFTRKPTKTPANTLENKSTF